MAVAVADILFLVLIVFGVGVVGVLVFGGWAVVSVLRLMGRILFGAGPSRQPPPLSDGVRCANPGCRADNPGRARYCRRCGRTLYAPHPAVARRAAML
jgi:hypothetical protein